MQNKENLFLGKKEIAAPSYSFHNVLAMENLTVAVILMAH